MRELQTSAEQRSPSGRLVAIFGISGVGKTTLIERFVRDNASWCPMSASHLLSELTHLHPDELRVADRASIENNQFSLAAAIGRRREELPEMNWLLDAHSVIDNGREFIVVPQQVIARINPDALIFIEDEPAHILRRRATDPQRDRPQPSIQRIEEEQSLALQACLLYSRELHLQLQHVSAADLPGFAAAITRSNV